MVTDVSSAENCATVVRIQSTCHCKQRGADALAPWPDSARLQFSMTKWAYQSTSLQRSRCVAEWCPSAGRVLSVSNAEVSPPQTLAATSSGSPSQDMTISADTAGSPEMEESSRNLDISLSSSGALANRDVGGPLKDEKDPHSAMWSRGLTESLRLAAARGPEAERRAALDTLMDAVGTGAYQYGFGALHMDPY
jgi:hypothetical protein